MGTEVEATDTACARLKQVGVPTSAKPLSASQLPSSSPRCPVSLIVGSSSTAKLPVALLSDDASTRSFLSPFPLSLPPRFLPPISSTPLASLPPVSPSCRAASSDVQESPSQSIVQVQFVVIRVRPRWCQRRTAFALARQEAVVLLLVIVLKGR